MDNLIGSEKVAVLGVIGPASLPAQAHTSSWVSVKGFENILVIVQTGVLGAAATVDVKLRQATSAAGGGAKDISGKALTQMAKATDDDKQAMINIRQEQFDVSNGFDYLGVTVTVAAAASLASVIILGINPRYGPASLGNAATVTQVVA